MLSMFKSKLKKSFEESKKASEESKFQGRNGNTQMKIFSHVSEFTAGSIKKTDDHENRYIPLFPQFYCKEV